MAKPKLTQEQLAAVLLTNYQELKLIFRDLQKLDVPEDDKRRKRILDDMKYLIQKGLKLGLRDKAIHSLFKGIGA